jgi:hypothetical protein
MAFKDLFKVYPNRNLELRSVAKQAYEFGKTIAREPSAAHSNGLDEHALRRQRSYVDHAMKMVEALNAKPIPDNPASHPTELPIDLSEEYVTFTSDVNGNAVPLNEATQLIAESWMVAAVELAKSQSASLAGSLVKFDYDRASNNLQVLAKILDEIEARPMLDLPETAEPGSKLQAAGGSGSSLAR